MSSPARARRMSSAEDVCPICLCAMDEQFSRPENCQHRFDLDCLTEWSKLRLSCPSCRAEFGAIYTYEIIEAKPKLIKVQKMEPPKEAEPFDETNPLDFTNCEICGGGQHEELLLICDQCDRGFHTYCLTPPLDGVPTAEQWFCPQCEETRSSLPSTSRATAPSARTIRLVQRTALAERVRRLLERTRRLVSESEESSEDESEADEEDVEDEGVEGVEDGEEEELTASSEEEGEIPEFFDDDARVLADIGDEPGDEPALPSVKRRSKKQREATAKKKKTTTIKKTKKRAVKRTTKGKKRKTKRRRRSRKTKHAEDKNGPMDAFVSRRGGTHDPIAKLSLLGAGLEPVADEDCLVTENSRRFDRPLLRRRDESYSPFRNEEVEEEKPAADSCDLLGSILPEQVKTLAPGRLFAIGGGRFNITDDFEKYKERKTNQLSSELKQRLGIPVDKNTSCEEKDGSISKDMSKERTGRDSTQRHPELPDRSATSHASKKNPENKAQRNDSKAYRGNGLESARKEDWKSTSKTVEEEKGSRARYSESKSRDRRCDSSGVGGSRHGPGLSNSRECVDTRSESKSHDRSTDSKSGRRDFERSRDVDRRNIAKGPNQSDKNYDRRDIAGRNCERPRETNRQFGSVKNELDPKLWTKGFRGEMGNNSHERLREESRRNEQDREEVRRNNNTTNERCGKESKGNSSDHHREEDMNNDSSRSKSHSQDRNSDFQKDRNYTYHGRREHREERSRNTTIKVLERGSYNRSINERPKSSDKPLSLSENFRQGTSSQTYSRSDRSQHQQRDASVNRRITPSRDFRKTEESEQEDKVAVKKPALVERKDKEVLKQAPAIEEVAPGPSSSTTVKDPPALPKTTSSSANETSQDKHKQNIDDSSDRVKIIDALAKEAIRHYKRSLSVDEYKDVMRAVVRECYKKKILEGSKIKEKVDECVRAIKNGEKLDVGHHGVKRSESSGGSSAVPPKKRQKV